MKKKIKFLSKITGYSRINVKLSYIESISIIDLLPYLHIFPNHALHI